MQAQRPNGNQHAEEVTSLSALFIQNLMRACIDHIFPPPLPQPLAASQGGQLLFASCFVVFSPLLCCDNYQSTLISEPLSELHP